MRFVHTADLHLGRKLAQMSLEEDFAHILDQLADLVVRARADALVVAGDVFDSPNPQDGAVRLWDGLITRMAEQGIPVLVAGGSHDVGAPLAVDSRQIDRSSIHVAGSLSGKPEHVEIEGVNVWLIPFVRPADVGDWAKAQGIAWDQKPSYDAAMRLVCDYIKGLPAFKDCPNVVVAHQLVCAGDQEPVRCDSEEQLSGTDAATERVDVSCFDGFDYVALGYCHCPQHVGRDTCRYAGSPLKLSSSEADQGKCFNVVGIKKTETGVRVKNKLVALDLLHDLRSIRGTLEELVALGEAGGERGCEDYVYAVLTDDAPDATAKLRHVWPNLVQVTFDGEAQAADAVEVAESEVDLGEDTGDGDASAAVADEPAAGGETPEADTVDAAAGDKVSEADVVEADESEVDLGEDAGDGDAPAAVAVKAAVGEVDLDKGVEDLFREFFARETGRTLSVEQEKMVADAFERAARKGDE